MKKVRIISLGEVITPSLEKGVFALAQLVSEKLSCEVAKAAELVKAAVGKNFGNIGKFKQGLLSEEEFNKSFIETIRNDIGVEITTEEFDRAWAKMNPEYKAFEDALSKAVKFHEGENQELVFVSFTNPKDMRQLASELEKNNVAFKLDDNGQLCEIAGIKLYSTYALKLSKEDVLKKAIIEARQTGSPRNSMFAEAKSDAVSVDVKYIYGNKQNQIEALQRELDATASNVQVTANQFGVDTILWNKEKMGLTEILNDKEPAQGNINISRVCNI